MALVLLAPLLGAAVAFFSTTPGSKAEHFVAMALLPMIVATYALLAFIMLPVVYVAAWIMPPITVALEPGHCCMIYLRSMKTPWRSFQRMIDEPNFFYFWGWQRLVFIPKHAFASRAEADRFFQMALTYWHEAKGTVPPPPPAPPDLSGVWPPAPQTAAAQEPGAAEAR